MVGRAREKRLALGALLVALFAGKANSLRGQTHVLSREKDPLVLGTIRKASERLAKTACQQVFSDFRDQEGRTLQEKLASLGHTGQTYLGLVHFFDASHEASCEKPGVLAVTSPGSRVVYLCGLRLTERILRQPTYAVAVIIHEELHSLGLGENPPSSEEISWQVSSRCGK